MRLGVGGEFHPSADMEHSALDIGGGLAKPTERVLMTCGVGCLRCLMWCKDENTRSGAGGGFHPQMPIWSVAHLIWAADW